MPATVKPLSTPNPISQREPELAERLAVFQTVFTDMLLDKLAAATMQGLLLNREQSPYPLADVKVNALVFRVLSKEKWDADDLRIFDAYWRDANLSPLYPDEFEESHHRIQHYVEDARKILDAKTPATTRR